MQKTYFGNFDLVRAIAAGLVFVAHSQLLPGETVAEPVGAFAVECFFALSGFLVGGILIRSADQPRRFWAGIPTFYFNRCIRIWVPYYLLIAVFTLILVARGRTIPDYWQHLPSALAYTFNWHLAEHGVIYHWHPVNHIWSLSVEEQFYLICPLVIGLLRKPMLILSCLLVAAVWGSAYAEVPYFTSIAFGVSLAALHALVSPTFWGRLRRMGLPVGIALFGCGMAWHLPRGNMVFATGAAALICGSTQVTPGNRWTRLAGMMSYSFYLYHCLGYYFASPISKLMPGFLEPVAYVGLAFVATMFLSYGSVRFIERPLIARREQIKNSIPYAAVFTTVLAWGSMVFGLWWVFA